MKVLVVDDEEDIRDALIIFLDKEGHSVVAANNGQIAIELLENGELFDLIISDFRMPGANGLQVADATSFPFILMSDELDCHREGMVFLEKPFRLEELKRVIKEVMAL